MGGEVLIVALDFLHSSIYNKYEHVFVFIVGENEVSALFFFCFQRIV